MTVLIVEMNDTKAALYEENMRKAGHAEIRRVRLIKEARVALATKNNGVRVVCIAGGHYNTQQALNIFTQVEEVMPR